MNVNRLKKLLMELISIYSPTGKEEEILNFLSNLFKRKKISFVRQEVDENRYNILIMPEEDVEILWLGHIDTVPAYDLEHYEPETEDNIIHGLGAADMKAGCAAMIEAFLSYHEKHLSLPPVALALVVGEEENGDGTQALLKEYQFPYALVAEPTNLVPCLSHYGYLEMQIKTFGKRKHASIATPESNAVYKMLQLLLKITSYLDKKKGAIIYNIRDMHSAESGFAAPDRCSSWLDLHVPPNAPIGNITFELEELIPPPLQKDNPEERTIRFSTIHAGYELPDKGVLPELLKSVFNDHKLDWKPSAFQSHSDANLLWGAGIKPLIFGPGDLSEAHSPTESIPFAQVVKATQIYYDLLLTHK